jgi:hypothetical protein
MFDEHLDRIVRSTVEWFEMHLSRVAAQSVAVMQHAPG